MLRIVMFASLLVLSGCGEDTKSVEWWLEHPKEATEKYLECKKTGEDSINCKNIDQVKRRIAIGYEPMKEAVDR